MKKLALFNSFYDTMKLYEDTYGEFGKASDMTRSMFYARLAYISLAENIREGSADEEEQDEDIPNDVFIAKTSRMDISKSLKK